MLYPKLIQRVNNYYELAIQAKQAPLYLYHGTSSKNLASILAQGLVQNPKKRVWEQDLGASFKNPSRVPVGGIYLTTKLDLAISAAQNSIKDKDKSKEHPIVIISQVSPGSIQADEDDVSKFLSDIKLTNAEANEVNSVKLWTLAYLNSNNSELESSKKNYIAVNLDKIIKKFSREVHPKLAQRLAELLNEGFLTALKRQVAYIPASIYNTIFTGIYSKSKPLSRTLMAEANAAAKASKPDINAVASEYNKYLDRVTKVCRAIFATTGVGRVEQDLSFAGKNKIIGVVDIISSDPFNYKIVYQTADKLPPQVLNEFEELKNNPLLKKKIY